MQRTSELTRENMRMRVDGAPPGEPAGHRLLVRVVAEDQETKGGIILPAKDKKACELGDVLIVGRNSFLGYGDNSPWCEAGDRVHFVRHAGKPVDFVNGNEEYRVINDEDVYYVCDSSEVDDA